MQEIEFLEQKNRKQIEKNKSEYYEKRSLEKDFFFGNKTDK